MALELEDTAPPPAEPCPPTDPRPGGGVLPDVLDPDAAARRQLADVGMSAVGLAADKDPDAFARAVITCDADLADAVKRSGMVHASTCAERACRALDELGIPWPEFSEPYVTGSAPATVNRILAATHASRGPSHRPALGDVVIVDAPWHVQIVTEANGDNYVTANGGERTATGAQCIALMHRVYVPGGMHGPATFGGHVVLDVGDAVALVEASRWVPSQG